MEKDKDEKIIAYRIGQGLFCPNCYEETVRGLKAAQDPNDPQVTVPSKPIKLGDISIYICVQCEVIIGDPKISAEKKRELEALREQRVRELETFREEQYLQMRLRIADQFEKKNLGTKALKFLDDKMKFTEFKINMSGELAKISQRIKLTRRTLHAACDGHPLNRRNILSLRKLHDDLAEKIDPVRSIVICSILDNILL